MNYKLVKSEDVFMIGIKAQMSFQTINEETGKLARQFMPRRHEVKNRVGTHTMSLQRYNHFDFKSFNPSLTFEKWVGVEVSDASFIPEGMELLTIPAGNYLVFKYQGTAQDFPQFWQQLHGYWLPNSEFELDNRPHFEKLPEGYNPMDSESEEEVWVPVK